MPAKKISTAQLIKRLSDLSRQFGGDFEGEKSAILKSLSVRQLKHPEEFTALHDTLCFMRAYPDSRKIEQLAERELQQFGSRVNVYRRISRDRRLSELTDSGIVNTLTRHPFGFEMALQLKEKYGGRVTLDWDDNLSSWEDKLFDYLPMLVVWPENDSIDNDDNFDLETFLTRARGRRSRDNLQGLLDLLSSAKLPKSVRRYFFESLDLELKWDLTACEGSRTLCRFPAPAKFSFKSPLLGRCHDLQEELKKPPAEIIRLTEAQGRGVIIKACEVLAVRNRELYPVTLANPAEIYKVEPGRGLQIFLFGTPPEIRLPLEANFGAMFTRNGLPIGYGIAATLFDRVEIAMNVFPAFRGGESAYIIEQFFKVFYHHFGSRVFLVRSMQMGNDEEEALHSGAFWFYYKLGFRAISPAVRKLAEKERAKQKRKPGYRTPLNVQKQLAKSDVVFFMGGSASKGWKEPQLAKLGYAVTDYFSKVHDGNRNSGMRKAIADTSKALRIKNFNAWKETEKTAFERFAPLLASINTLNRWKPEEKKALVKIVRARGSGLDRDYSLLCIEHTKFRQAIERLAGLK